MLNVWRTQLDYPRCIVDSLYLSTSYQIQCGINIVTRGVNNPIYIVNINREGVKNPMYIDWIVRLGQGS